MMTEKREGFRGILRVFIPFLLMPVLVYLGGWKMGDRLYAWVILGMVILTQILFFTGFEDRKSVV